MRKTPLTDEWLKQLGKKRVVSSWQDVLDLAEFTRTFEERLASVEVDAARYRWLRENGNAKIYSLQKWTKGDEHSPLTLAQTDSLDVAIDAALSAEKPPIK